MIKLIVNIENIRGERLYYAEIDDKGIAELKSDDPEIKTIINLNPKHAGKLLDDILDDLMDNMDLEYILPMTAFEYGSM